ncbi:MAG: hypothetical protein LBU39_04500 [Desulfobulbaceae bacterium]|jgi:hypothetical protein|nr:hypothetical protein [Desulfobulbaceae bacterium]
MNLVRPLSRPENKNSQWAYRYRPPRRFVRGDEFSSFRRGAAATHETNRTADAGRREHRLLCARCGHFISRRDEAISIDGGHEHTFCNPSGIVFIVRLFCHAPGCRFHGEASREFSWFSGHSWRLAHCGGCGQHLGWLFLGEREEFVALIASAIREQD